MKKLSNTISHLIVGLVAGAIIGAVIGFTMWFEAAIMMCIVFYFLTIGFEGAQRASSTDPNYISKKWLDSIVDIAAGNIGFNLMFWIIMWFGGYFV